MSKCHIVGPGRFVNVKPSEMKYQRNWLDGKYDAYIQKTKKSSSLVLLIIAGKKKTTPTQVILFGLLMINKYSYVFVPTRTLMVTPTLAN